MSCRHSGSLSKASRVRPVRWHHAVATLCSRRATLSEKEEAMPLSSDAGIDLHAARRASVEIRSFLWRRLVLSARNVVHGRQNPRANAEVSIARMPAAQSNASKTPRVGCFKDDFTRDVGIALAGLDELDQSPGNEFVWSPRAAGRKAAQAISNAIPRSVSASTFPRPLTRVHCRRRLEQETVRAGCQCAGIVDACGSRWVSGRIPRNTT